MRINDFLKIFDTKYKGEKLVIPTNVNLLNYGLKKEHYQVFQDSSKTVLIGYTINGYRWPSPSEQKYENSKKNEKIHDDPLANMGKFTEHDKPSNFVVFGLEVDIDYYYNEEFNKLFKVIKSDSNIAEKSDERNKQKEIERKNISKDNHKEL